MKKQDSLWTEERSAALPKSKKKPASAAAKRRLARESVPLKRSPFATLPGAKPLELSVAQSLAYYGVIGIHVRVNLSGKLEFDGQLSDPEAGQAWLDQNELEIKRLL